MIYLDNASTTRPFDRVTDECIGLLREEYYNPSALYCTGARVRGRIERSREILARRLGVKPGEVVFTSGATESNNWAITSGFKNKKGNIVVSAGEHPSVYETALALKNAGYDVRIAPLNADGFVDEQAFARMIDGKTALVSVMHVSNETGAVNDIKRLNRLVKEIAPKAVFHSDGVQAFGKIEVNVDDLGVELYSVSAHKIGGLKGAGALVKRIALSPLLIGGGQEGNLRSGTENTPGVITFGTAADCIAATPYDPRAFSYACQTLQAVDGVRINTPARHSGHILSASVVGIKSEVLQHMLSDEGILIGLGSACSSKKSGNRVLSAMGLSEKYIAGNIRLSFGPGNTLDETKTAMERILYSIEKLRGNLRG